MVDLPPEADDELCIPALNAGLNFIRLATPTTDDKRLPAVLKNTSGFRLLRLDHRHHRHGLARPVKGREGSGKNQTAHHIAGSRRFRCETAAQAGAIGHAADGVVVGSALVSVIRDSLDAGGKATKTTVSAVTDFVAELARGVRAPQEAAE